MARADESVVREAIAAAEAAQPAMAALPAYERKAILMHVRRVQCCRPDTDAGLIPDPLLRTHARSEQLVKQFEERHEELSQALCIEAGKPIKCVPCARGSKGRTA